MTNTRDDSIHSFSAANRMRKRYVGISHTQAQNLSGTAAKPPSRGHDHGVVLVGTAAKPKQLRLHPAGANQPLEVTSPPHTYKRTSIQVTSSSTSVIAISGVLKASAWRTSLISAQKPSVAKTNRWPGTAARITISGSGTLQAV